VLLNLLELILRKWRGLTQSFRAKQGSGPQPPTAPEPSPAVVAR
jgi:hypothetical protein